MKFSNVAKQTADLSQIHHLVGETTTVKSTKNERLLIWISKRSLPLHIAILIKTWIRNKPYFVVWHDTWVWLKSAAISCTTRRNWSIKVTYRSLGVRRLLWFELLNGTRLLLESPRLCNFQGLSFYYIFILALHLRQEICAPKVVLSWTVL